MSRYVFLASLIFAQACSSASASPPFAVSVLIEHQSGDSAQIIGAWGPAQAGTFPLSHYHTRLLQNGDTLRQGATESAMQTVDTLWYPYLPYGDTLEGLQFAVQAEDTEQFTSAYVLSAPFPLTRPFSPPGEPGVPSVRVDTGLTAIATDFLLDSLPVLHVGFGAVVMRARLMADVGLVYCEDLLLAEETDSIVIAARTDCDEAIVPVDSIYIPDGNASDGGWETQAGIKAGMTFRIIRRGA